MTIFKVNFEVRDSESESQIELPSRSLKVDPSNDLLRGLAELEVFNYKLN